MTEEAHDGRGGSEPPAATAELVDHATRPRNLGFIQGADICVETKRECGDSIEISLVVRRGVIRSIGFVPHGCVFTLACASAATSMAKGKTLAEARREVQPEAIDAALGGLPEGEGHCADFAARAVWSAIDEYLRTQNEPWKRLYRKV